MKKFFLIFKYLLQKYKYININNIDIFNFIYLFIYLFNNSQFGVKQLGEMQFGEMPTHNKRLD